MDNSTLTKLFNAVIENGGFTVNTGTFKPATSGYVVSGLAEQPDLIPRDEFTPARLHTCLLHLLENHPEAPHVGAWVHEGQVYIEPTEVCLTLMHALDKGVERNQIALWHLDTSSEIQVKDAPMYRLAYNTGWNDGILASDGYYGAMRDISEE